MADGQLDGWYGPRHNDYFVLKRGMSARKVAMEPGYEREWLGTPSEIHISPDSRYAVALRPAAKVPAEWQRYTEPTYVYSRLPTAINNPSGPNLIMEWVLIDLLKASAKPLYSAPANLPASAAWSPDSRSVMVGPAFAPADNADENGLAGKALVLIDIRSGKVTQISVPADKPRLRVVRWRSGGVVELTTGRYGGEATDTVRVTGDRWKFDAAIAGANKRAAVAVALRQDLNTSPALFANEKSSGKEYLLLDLNPELRNRKIVLGRVDLVHWKALDGTPWSGLMFYPTSFVAGRSYPLVIQTHGFSATDFSPDGSAISTAFAAQEMANQGVAVLQLGGPDKIGADVGGTEKELKVYTSGFEGAIQHFIATGLADHTKIGIIGFSRTVWMVEYMLTHPNVPIAAAIVSDGIEGSYFEYIFGEDAARAQDNGFYGAAPIGKGIDAWVNGAPGFNVDKVQAPLRIEFCWGPIQRVVPKWEVFSNLRYLHKPVEMYIIPDIAHGVHQLQNPKQRLASLGGTVDWFRFWLKGEEDPDPAKKDQYIRWRELRKRQQENETRHKEAGSAPIH